MQMRREDQFVTANVIARPHNIHIHTRAKQRVVISFDRIAMRSFGISGLNLQCPDAVVIVNDGDLRLRRRSCDRRC